MSEPARLSGSDTLRCAYSNDPKCSSLVAFVLPTRPGFALRVVCPNRRFATRSESTVNRVSEVLLTFLITTYVVVLRLHQGWDSFEMGALFQSLWEESVVVGRIYKYHQ